jgi:hypothetical protein
MVIKIALAAELVFSIIADIMESFEFRVFEFRELKNYFTFPQGEGKTVQKSRWEVRAIGVSRGKSARA